MSKYAIDYGTTNSSIAVSYKDDNGSVITKLAKLEDTNPEYLMPSRVVVDNGGNLRVGRSNINNMPIDSSARILSKVKLDLEPATDAPSDFSAISEKTYTVNNHSVTITDVIAAVLKQMKKQADDQFRFLHLVFDGVVMGVPVNFGDVQKKILKLALVRAGFFADETEAEKHTEFVSEPVAAAINYGEDLRSNRDVFVFDFGGGTLDFAVMNLQRQIGMLPPDCLHPHEVKCKDRATVGGEKLTKAFFVNSFCSMAKYGADFFNKAFHLPTYLSAGELWDWLQSGKCGPSGWLFVKAVDDLKCRLSKESEVFFSFIKEKVAVPRKPFTRADFERAISLQIDGEEVSAFEEIKQAIKNFIENNRIDTRAGIETVLLAGGSSEIPCVQQYLHEIFSIDDQWPETNHNASPLTTIVRGLSLVGLKTTDSIEDTVDTDYGSWNDRTHQFQPIIERGTKIKDTAFDRYNRTGICRDFHIIDHNANFVKIKIMQKANNVISNLGTIKIRGTDQDNYEMYMTIDRKQGILSVYIFDVTLGIWVDQSDRVSLVDCIFKINL